MSLLLFIISMWPFPFCEVIIILIFLYYLLIKKKMYINKLFLVLVMFSLLYVFSLLLNYQAAPVVSIGIGISFLCMYLIGYWQSYSMEYRKDSRGITNRLLFNCELETMSVGLFFHGLLNIYATKQRGSWGNIIAETYDFWTGTVIVRTFFSTLFTASIAVAIYYIISKKFWKTIIGTAIIAIGIWCSFSVGSRSMISILFGLICIITVIYLISNYESLSRKIRVIIILGVMIGVFLTMYAFDFAGIANYIEKSSLFQRFFLTHSSERNLLDNSSRNTIILNVLSNCTKYPFGGLHLQNGTSAHNTWIDVLRVSGFPGILFFLIFELLVLRKLLQNIKEIGFFDYRVLLSLLIFIAINMNFYVESLFALNKVLSYLFFFCCGCISGTNTNMLKVKKYVEYNSVS